MSSQTKADMGKKEHESQMDPTVDRARELFDSGWYCAEAVLQAIAEDQRIATDVIPRIAIGMTAGIARTGGLCGAVCGAIMGLGLVMGRENPGDPVDPAFGAVQQLMAEFEGLHSATSCRTLTGVDLNTPEGQAAFRESGHITHCQEYVGTATRLALELIRDYNQTTESGED